MKTLKILTLVFNFCIFVGAGHGIGILGLIEILTVSELFQGNVNFNFTGTYDDRLGTVGLLTLIGQACLILSFFFKNQLQSTMTIMGCAILLIGILILTRDATESGLDMISLLFSIPFIVADLTLLVRELWTMKKNMRMEA